MTAEKQAILRLFWGVLGMLLLAMLLDYGFEYQKWRHELGFRYWVVAVQDSQVKQKAADAAAAAAADALDINRWTTYTVLPDTISAGGTR